MKKLLAVSAALLITATSCNNTLQCLVRNESSSAVRLAITSRAPRIPLIGVFFPAAKRWRLHYEALPLAPGDSAVFSDQATTSWGGAVRELAVLRNGDTLSTVRPDLFTGKKRRHVILVGDEGARTLIRKKAQANMTQAFVLQY